MSELIIELHDRNIRISDREQTLAQSPGFASIAPPQPLFGEEARRQFRLHPRLGFNQFWSQLSLDPLANTNSHFRHQADLAYGHLLSLLQDLEPGSEAIFVVPAHYSRNQLAILLGLVKQSPLIASGLVDLAVVSTLDQAEGGPLVHVDIQLHQSVLSRLQHRDGRWQRESVAQIPGAGLLALHEAWASTITDAFIKQSRFDPLHNADTEQYIHNRLPDWLEAAREGEVLLEINHKGKIYQANINRGHFEQKARAVLSRLRQELDMLGASARVCLAADLARLPGFSLYLPEARGVEDGAAQANCYAALGSIKGDPDALAFVTSLPLAIASAPQPADGAAPSSQPSHVLINDHAYALPADLLYIGAQPRDPMQPEGSRFIAVQDPALSSPLVIRREARGYVLDKGSHPQLRINGQPPAGARLLALGDRIDVADSSLAIQLIQVR